MTLIKRGSPLASRAADYRVAAPSLARPADIAPDTEPAEQADPREQRIAELTGRVAELEAALEAASGGHEEACSAAYERGRADGTEAAETLEHERLAALNSALEAAVAALGRHIDQERDVAVDIARGALDRLFADPSLYAGMVAETARRQASSLARGSILALRVSATDFPDPGALALLPALGADVRVEADASLASGACLFDLTLGSLDASIAQQAAVIANILGQSEGKAVPA